MSKHFLGKEMLFVYYKYLDRFHVVPKDMQDLVDFIAYGDTVAGIDKYFAAMAKSEK